MSGHATHQVDDDWDKLPHRHATAYFRPGARPNVASGQPDEMWTCCYPDGLLLVPSGSG